MNTLLVFAATLVIRNIIPVNGTVDIRPVAGEEIVAAYSVDVNPIHHHSTRESKVERLADVKKGRVTGIAERHQLVEAVIIANGTFDRTRPIVEGREVFPYSDEVVQTYRKICGHDYVTDMMLVVQPYCNNGWARDEAVADLYRTIMAIYPDAYSANREFGPKAGEGVAIVFGRLRTLNWLDTRAYCDEGAALAEATGAKGRHVDFVPSTALAAFTLDAEGWIVFGGRRLTKVVCRHFDGCDARTFADLFGGRSVKTAVFAYDSPTLPGSHAIFSAPEL